MLKQVSSHILQLLTNLSVWYKKNNILHGHINSKHNFNTDAIVALKELLLISLPNCALFLLSYFYYFLDLKQPSLVLQKPNSHLVAGGDTWKYPSFWLTPQY